MKHLVLFLALFGLATALWAHEGHSPDATDFQSDRCAECGMVVTSRSYAAQIVGSDNALFFDDIGCLIQHERQGKVVVEVHARFVRSVASEAWLRVENAVWVLSKAVRTPMGYGLHAFADAPSAEAFAANQPGAQVLAWKDVPAVVTKRSMM